MEHQNLLMLVEKMKKKQREANIAKSKIGYQENYKCDKCKDTGFVTRVNSNGSITYKRCDCIEIDKAKRTWRDSGIKDNNKTFKDFEIWNDASKKLKLAAINYYKNYYKIKNTNQNSIMLCGQPGCGKTYLSLALANNFMNTNKVKVVYMPYRDVVTSIKQNLTDKEFYKKTLDKYKNAELLLVDDLYKGKITEADINIIFEIVNHRYLNKMPMIISTECTLGRLLEVDEAIGSRIYEMCKDYFIQVKGLDNNYRLREI